MGTSGVFSLEEGEKEICAVCHDELGEDDVPMKCGHALHTQCKKDMNSSASSRYECPTCRSPAPPPAEEVEEAASKAEPPPPAPLEAGVELLSQGLVLMAKSLPLLVSGLLSRPR